MMAIIEHRLADRERNDVLRNVLAKTLSERHGEQSLSD